MSGVDYVFHLAAMISVPESMEQPNECVRINVLGLLNILRSAEKHGVKKLLHASSAAVYGDNPIVLKTETMLPDPKSPYAITKLDGEHYLEMFRLEGKLRTTSLRFFNVFGPRQDPKSAYAAAVPIFMQKALTNEDITIFGDGGQTRDFIYVKDIVRALAHAAESAEMHGTYNIGCGGSTRIIDLATNIIRLTGSRSSIQHAPARLGDVRHSTSNIDKILATDWNPLFTLEQGLEAALPFLIR